MSKQDLSRDEWEEATREMRKDFDKRFNDMEKLLRKNLAREQEEIEEGEGLNIDALRDNIMAARTRVAGAVKKGDKAVSDHPLLIVGGALAIGVLIGALAASKSRED